MELKTLDNSITQANNNNNVVIASAGINTPLVIEDLQAIINLSSVGVSNFADQLSKVLQLSLRDTSTNRVTDLLRIPIYNKRIPYSENLLSFLTSTNKFILSANRELRLTVMNLGGTFPNNGLLSGSDLISVIGQAYIPDTATSAQVTQNFVTANYAVPSRDALLALPLGTNWTALDTDRAPKYYKDQIGRVHLTGFARIVASNGSLNLGTFPTGYRPTESLDFMVSYSSSMLPIQLLTNGSVNALSVPPAWINLTGISFLAA